MKSTLQFLNAEDRSTSNCGKPIEIEKSSSDLGWEGFIVEKGWSPHFYPENIVTPYFYFALALDQELKWEVKHNEHFEQLKTNPGDIWVNPPWVPFTHRIDEPCFFIILAIEENKLYDVYPDNLPHDELQFLKNYNLHDPLLKNFIELFYFEVEKNGINGDRYIHNLLTTFSEYFMHNYSNCNALKNNSPASRITKDHVSIIRNFIVQNIDEPITIEELAAEINMSKFYFLKEFKKATELTPYQYLVEIRMDKAMELIKDSDMSLINIAVNLGFSDQSHFSKVFKQYFGVPPGMYRKQGG